MAGQHAEVGAVYTDGTYWVHRMNANSDYKVRLVGELLQQVGHEWPPGAKIAEVGSGPGSFLLPLVETLHAAEVAATYTAFDISPDAIAEGRARSEAKSLPIQWHVGSAADMPAGWDYIFIMDVLEHLENPAQFLRDVAGKSRYVILHLPIEQSLGHMLMDRPSASFDLFAHLQFYSLDSAKILLNTSPFRVVDYLFSAASRATLDPRCSRLVRLVKVIRYHAYRINPRFASIAAGGSTLWLLENKTIAG
jgi:hypothetical protein